MENAEVIGDWEGQRAVVGRRRNGVRGKQKGLAYFFAPSIWWPAFIGCGLFVSGCNILPSIMIDSPSCSCVVVPSGRLQVPSVLHTEPSLIVRSAVIGSQAACFICIILPSFIIQQSCIGDAKGGLTVAVLVLDVFVVVVVVLVVV